MQFAECDASDTPHGSMHERVRPFMMIPSSVSISQINKGINACAVVTFCESVWGRSFLFTTLLHCPNGLSHTYTHTHKSLMTRRSQRADSSTLSATSFQQRTLTPVVASCDAQQKQPNAKYISILPEFSDLAALVSPSGSSRSDEVL